MQPSSMHLISPAQIRAARHLARLSQADVAEDAGPSFPTVKRAESERNATVSPEAITKIRTVLEAARVAFDDDGRQARGCEVPRKVQTLDNRN